MQEKRQHSSRQDKKRQKVEVERTWAWATTKTLMNVAKKDPVRFANRYVLLLHLIKFRPFAALDFPAPRAVLN